MNFENKNPFYFYGLVRFNKGVPTGLAFKNGRWAFEFDHAKKYWMFCAEEVSQRDLRGCGKIPQQQGKNPHCDATVGIQPNGRGGKRLCQYPLHEATNIPCRPPSGSIFSITFDKCNADIKSDKPEDLRQIYELIQNILKNSTEEVKLCKINKIPSSSSSTATNGIQNLNICHPNSSSGNGTENRRHVKRLNIETAQSMLLSEDNSPQKEEARLDNGQDHVTTINGTATTNGNDSYTRLRVPNMTTRIRSECNQITPKKFAAASPSCAVRSSGSRDLSSSDQSRQSAVALLDKENENKTPTNHSGVPMLQSLKNRTPLADKCPGLSTSRFYGRDSSLNFSAKIPGVNNLPSAQHNYARSTRVSKRIRPELDVETSKRLKRLNSENDALWKTTASTPPSKQPLLGFSNLGNTCYMNSILQSLFGLDVFTRELWKTYTQLKDYVTQDSLLYSLPQLLKNKDSTSRSTKDELLLSIKNAISASATRFSGFSQHDAHEFLAQVLDQLKEEIKKLSEESAQAKKLTNPVENNFEFRVSHCIECQACGNNVTKEEQFHDLSLDLPFSPEDEDHPTSLQKLIDAFFRSEEVTYKCERCNSDLSIIRHKFIKLPRILILHVKRYNFDSKISKNVKCTNTIVIPKFLALSHHCNAESRLFPDLTASTKKLVQFLETTPPKFKRNKANNVGGDPSSHSAELMSPLLPEENVESRLTPPQHQSSSPAKAKRRLYSSTPSTSSFDRTSPYKKYNFRNLERTMDYNEKIAASTPSTADVPGIELEDDPDLQAALQQSLTENQSRPEEQDDDFQQQMAEAMKRSLLPDTTNDSLNESANSSITEPNALEKLEKDVLDFEERVENGTCTDSFRLCGIVTHLGHSSSTGHYVCDVYDVRNDRWRSYDDSRVTDTNLQDVQTLRRKDGYIFFYVAKKILDEIDNSSNSGTND